MESHYKKIAAELSINQKQVSATVDLLDEGATVPFIARYRKEVTGTLDEVQINEAETMVSLEDIYLPYRPKRKTRATTAREKGLQPLADLLMEQKRID